MKVGKAVAKKVSGGRTAVIGGKSQGQYRRILQRWRNKCGNELSNEKSLEFLGQVEWSAMTYGLHINQMSRAMPELLKSKPLKWFIANNRFSQMWDEFIQSFQDT